MTTTKTIGELPATKVLLAAGLFEVEQDGVSKKISAADLFQSLIPGGLPDLGPIEDRLTNGETLYAEFLDTFGSAVAAKDSANAADQARLAASIARGYAQQARDEAQTFRNDATGAYVAATDAANQALTQALAAAGSSSIAAGYATTASSKADAAAGSASAAQGSAVVATAGASGASVSSGQAASAATAAAGSASAADVSRLAASTQAANAALSATAAASTLVSVTAQAALVATSVALTATAVTGVVKNGLFAAGGWGGDSTNPSNPPPSWGVWVQGGYIGKGPAESVYGASNVLQIDRETNVNSGVLQGLMPLFNGIWVIDVEMAVQQGSSQGVSVLIRHNGDYTGFDFNIHAATAADGVTGEKGGFPGVYRKYTKIFTISGIPGNGLYAFGQVYLCAGYEGLYPFSGFARTYWQKIVVRPATPEEIASGRADVNASLALANNTAESIARAAADTALSSTLTTLNTQVGQFNANLTAETIARSSAIDALTTSSTALTASLSNTLLNPNCDFTNWPAGTGIPASWNDWANGAIASRTPRGDRTGYAYTVAVVANDPNQGITQYLGNVLSGWYIVEVDVILLSGSLQGAGILWRALDAANGVLQDQLVDLYNDKTTTDAPAGPGTPGYTYRYRKPLFAPAGTAGIQMYLMNAYPPYFGNGSAKFMHWLHVGFRPASAAEVAGMRADANAGAALAQINAEQVARITADSVLASQITTVTTSVGSLSASVTQITTSLNGVNASWGVRVDVNGRITGISLIGSGASTDFIVVADRFAIVDPSAPGSPQTVFEVAGGITRIRNAIIGTSNVDWGNLANGSQGQASGSYFYTPAAFRGTGVWNTILAVNFNAYFGRPVKIMATMACRQTGGSNGSEMRFRIIRNDGIIVYGTTAGMPVKVDGDGGTVALCAFDSAAVPYTGYSYTVEMQMIYGDDTVTFGDRFMLVEELARTYNNSFTIQAPGQPGLGGGTGGGGGGGGGGGNPLA